MEKKFKLMFWFVVAILFFSMLGNCTSCANMKKQQEVIDELKTHIDENFYNKDELIIIMEIKNLEAERRTVLNTNQIFLRKKRPDQRVIEIDKEIGEKQNKLDAMVKKRLEDVKKQKQARELK